MNTTAAFIEDFKEKDIEKLAAYLINLTHDGMYNLSSNISSLSNFILYTNRNLDDFFFIVNGILVLFMQVGFACLEAGSIRAKNVTSIMLKNYLDCLICSIVFWLTGYAIAFGRGNAFVGWTWWAGTNLPDRLWSEWFFQFTFASTASTILSGAIAERSSFVSYLLYSVLMSGFIYPVVVHWVWSSHGWLHQIGFVDFAGGMLIHGLSGSAALIAAIIVGPRIGRFESYPEYPIPGHSTALVGIGAIIIFVGFCGFNAGTLNHFSRPGDGVLATIVVRNTLMSCAGGALMVLFIGKLGGFEQNFWPFAYSINGGIAGLVSSCGACDRFSCLESIIIGAIAGVIYTFMHHAVVHLKIDDPLDSSPIHMACGIWSVIAIPLIENGGVIFRPFNDVFQELIIQIIGVIAIMIWSFLTSTLLFGSLHIFKLLRSTEKEEIIGMDVSKHNEPAYIDEIVPHLQGISNRQNELPPFNLANNRPVSVICTTPAY